ncbi:MAG: hydroxymethylglutaryl-CoA synthase family protein [Rhodospirillaceae bacterium]|nr:hydroxymethylglutaryl-CoA synthase family protein [Rhodospirillaceae bacterium]MYB14198.1 hydroxymethylglutaryl-CoA synthase family protein [Rhodospirillaceae bacterium]MYI47658.1 hydroxymethylglutaryl-CoA synthase family protein [Rhodospirillaceae bacterium]
MPGSDTVGLKAYGAYVPRLRLSRKAIAEANAWFNPAIKGLAKGERAICNWDEDSLTMGVEAARDCLTPARLDGGAATIAAVHFASTTLPFGDRQNAGILATALNFGENVATMDFTASQRAGTSGLLNALRSAKAGDTAGDTLFVAADKRRTQASGPQELQFGDAAAAFTVGGSGGGVIAAYLGGHQLSTDFIDHYRGGDSKYDYNWEERWIRDEGYFKIAPRAIAAALAEAGLDAGAVDRFIMPALIRGVPQKVAALAGIRAEAVRDTLQAQLGEAGTAHPLVMLADCLQEAAPGETILVVGWGQGCDALLFRTTDALASLPPRQGVKGWLARRREETNYNRYLSFNDLLEQDRGIRAELDAPTALSALYRNRDMVLGFVGGKCRICGTVQYPKTRACVSPNCGAFNSQDPHPFAEIPAKVQSWTADNLTYSPDPPAHFGMVVFDEGGRLMADMTDVAPGEVAVGMPVRMVFRRRAVDDKRGFIKYFWKATPDHTAGETTGGSE